MLGLDNPIHIVFLLILLLLVFGAKRLPELGKSLGSGLRGFKESISGEDQVSAISHASTVPDAERVPAPVMHGPHDARTESSALPPTA